MKNDAMESCPQMRTRDAQSLFEHMSVQLWRRSEALRKRASTKRRRTDPYTARKLDLSRKKEVLGWMTGRSLAALSEWCTMYLCDGCDGVVTPRETLASNSPGINSVCACRCS